MATLPATNCIALRYADGPAMEDWLIRATLSAPGAALQATASFGRARNISQHTTARLTRFQASPLRKAMR